MNAFYHVLNSCQALSRLDRPGLHSLFHPQTKGSIVHIAVRRIWGCQQIVSGMVGARFEVCNQSRVYRAGGHEKMREKNYILTPTFNPGSDVVTWDVGELIS